MLTFRLNRYGDSGYELDNFFFSLANCTIFWGHPVVAYNYTYKFYNSLDNNVKVFGSGSQTLRLEAEKYSMARVVGFTR